MLFQEEKRIRRDVNCVRTGESWYLADHGSGGAERELRLWWFKVCKCVLRPPSIHSASWWTWVQGG